MKILKLGLLTVIFYISFTSAAAAEGSPKNGRYEARVKTEDGIYTVPVEVEDGAITSIRWPNGGKMKFRGTDLDRGEAVGRNFHGDKFKISIDDPQYNERDDTYDSE